VILNIATGAVMMDEYKLYSATEFVFILFTGIVSILGVLIIVRKPVKA
jgi:hypothetical protein